MPFTLHYADFGPDYSGRPLHEPRGRNVGGSSPSGLMKSAPMSCWRASTANITEHACDMTASAAESDDRHEMVSALCNHVVVIIQ